MSYHSGKSCPFEKLGCKFLHLFSDTHEKRTSSTITYSLGSFFTSTPRKPFKDCEECMDSSKCTDCIVKHTLGRRACAKLMFCQLGSLQPMTGCSRSLYRWSLNHLFAVPIVIQNVLYYFMTVLINKQINWVHMLDDTIEVDEVLKLNLLLLANQECLQTKRKRMGTKQKK